MYPTESQSPQELLSPELQQRSILVVDDNEVILSLVRDILTRNGFLVRCVDNTDDARKKIADQQPDIIICDIMMPHEDGFSLYKSLRSHESFQNIPFIFLTGMTESTEVRFAKELGVDDYITKPFEPEDLISVIKGKLKRSEGQQHFVNKKMEDFRKRVIHTLSHEFRTPLVAVNTGTEILKEQYKKLDENVLADLLDSVQRGGMRLQRLVEDFITLQQIDSGHAESTSKRFARNVDFSDLVARAIEYFKDDLDPKDNLEILVSKPGDSCKVKVYEMQVINVINRILSNAKKFGPKGKPIEVSIKSDGNNVSVLIRDYGRGMPKEVAEEACGLFSQINRETMEQQGCGLGLAIACSYLKLNGGCIQFHQPEDQIGTIVELQFPVIC